MRAWQDLCTIEMQTEQNEWQLLGHRAQLLQTDPCASTTFKVYSEFHICIMVARFQSW
jgi:hypothetical protein